MSICVVSYSVPARFILNLPQIVQETGPPWSLTVENLSNLRNALLFSSFGLTDEEMGEARKAMKVAYHNGEPPTFEGFSRSFRLSNPTGLYLKLCRRHRLNVFVKSDIPYSLNSR